MMLKQVITRTRKPRRAPANWTSTATATDKYELYRFVPKGEGRSDSVYVGTLYLGNHFVPKPILDKLLNDAERDEVTEKWGILCGDKAGMKFRRDAVSYINTSVSRIRDCADQKHLDQETVDAIAAALAKMAESVAAAGFTLLLPTPETPTVEKRKYTRKTRTSDGVANGNGHVDEGADNQIEMPLTKTGDA